MKNIAFDVLSEKLTWAQAQKRGYEREINNHLNRCENLRDIIENLETDIAILSDALDSIDTSGP